MFNEMKYAEIKYLHVLFVVEHLFTLSRSYNSDLI